MPPTTTKATLKTSTTPPNFNALMAKLVRAIHGNDALINTSHTEMENWTGNLQNPSTGAYNKLVMLERSSKYDAVKDRYTITFKVLVKTAFYTDVASNKKNLWRTVCELDADTPSQRIADQLAIATLYVRAQPALRAKADDWSSYKDYLDDFHKFSNDVQELFETYSSSDLSSIGTTHSEILQKAFGNAPRDSLWNITREIDKQLASRTKVKESPAMPTPDKSVSRTQQLLAAARRGAIIGAVGATSRKGIDTAINSLGPNTPDWLKSELTKKVIEGALPFFILQLLELDTQNRVPAAMKEKLVPLFEAAWESWAQDSGAKVVEEIYKLAGPLLNEYLGQAEQLAALADHQNVEDAEELVVDTRVKMRVEEKVL